MPESLSSYGVGDKNMTDDRALQAVRDRFADIVTSGIDRDRARIRAAFAAVPRERFLGPGPWRLAMANGLIQTQSDDPAEVYEPTVFSLDRSLGINNGEPQLHAKMLSAAAPQPGETVLQIGTGTGYYTAILAELVGPSGTVMGYEIVEALAKRAVNGVQDQAQVKIRVASGTDGPLPPSDVIYVCAGATGPVRHWLEALKPGGRLIFPLTPDNGFGAILRLTAPANTTFADHEAAFITPAMFIDCQGARDTEVAKRLDATFAKGHLDQVRSLRFSSPPDETAWFIWSDSLWLSTAPPPPSL